MVKLQGKIGQKWGKKKILVTQSGALIRKRHPSIKAKLRSRMSGTRCKWRPATGGRCIV